MTQGGAIDAIELGVFSSRLEAVCDEMGAVLKRAAFSPNIKDRLDYSCAVFDARGELCAQAAHIPVHLGSMAYAMAGIVHRMQWAPGDMVMLNDPYLGGTHLPDVTVIAPFYSGGRLLGFVANRAHHANIGADSPGSMPLSTHIDQEGVLLSPVHLIKQGAYQPDVVARLARVEASGGDALGGDFQAQCSANRAGVARIQSLVMQVGEGDFVGALTELNDYGERLARSQYEAIPDGVWRFTDLMDDDGAGNTDLPIVVALTVRGSEVCVDFDGTAEQTPGNINCPLSVAAAAVYYVFRCLLPDFAPGCAGLFRPIELRAAPGSLVNAQYPAAVAAGNVETSSRIVDAVLGALAAALPGRIPAASHGSMNNIAMGSRSAGWNYYETIGGGMGASARGEGLSGVQTHMTNTFNTPIESLEAHYPLLVLGYRLRRGSGGPGVHRGGDGLVRELEFQAPAEVTLLCERRRHQPWGLAGGGAGQAGENRLNGEHLPGKCAIRVQAGDRLSVASAGGGGWSPDKDQAK